MASNHTELQDTAISTKPKKNFDNSPLYIPEKSIDSDLGSLRYKVDELVQKLDAINIGQTPVDTIVATHKKITEIQASLEAARVKLQLKAEEAAETLRNLGTDLPSSSDNTSAQNE